MSCKSCTTGSRSLSIAASFSSRGRRRFWCLIQYLQIVPGPILTRRTMACDFVSGGRPKAAMGHQRPRARHGPPCFHGRGCQPDRKLPFRKGRSTRIHRGSFQIRVRCGEVRRRQDGLYHWMADVWRGWKSRPSKPVSNVLRDAAVC
jgi:hypothetical protein